MSHAINRGDPLSSIQNGGEGKGEEVLLPRSPQDRRCRTTATRLHLCAGTGSKAIYKEVHLGGTDCDIGAARRLLGDDKIIGASCYNQLNLAEKAQAQGASYAAFGACFATSTKLGAVNAPLSLFAEAKQKINIPLVAIGGITLQNAASVKSAGADAIAVINALFASDNIKQTAQQFISNFKMLLI